MKVQDDFAKGSYIKEALISKELSKSHRSLVIFLTCEQ